MKRIAEDHFPEYIRFHKAFRDYRRITTVARDFKPFVVVICGPSGVGKTRFATNLGHKLGSFYRVPNKHTGLWCDDYDGQEVFFLDEMNGNKCTPEFFNEVKKLFLAK